MRLNMVVLCGRQIPIRPCAIFDRGEYAVLWNCELREFVVVNDIGG